MSFSMLRSAVLVGAGLTACFSSYAEVDPLRTQIQPLAKSSLVLDIANTGQNLVAVGQRGHVLVKQTQWQQVASPVVAQLTKVFFIDENLGWAVGHDASIIHTQDGGQSWTKQMQSQQIEKPFLDVLFFDKLHGIAVGAYGLFYRTTDGGNTWVEEFHEELLFEEDVAYLEELKLEDEALYLSEKSALLPHFNRVIQLADQRLLMVGELGTITVSDDLGKTFSKVDFSYDGSMFTSIEHGDDIYVMGLRGHVFKTDANFSQWLEIAMPVESSINDAFVTTDNKLLIVGNAGAIIEINNNSAELLQRRQGENIVALSADKDGQLWFAGSKGLFQLDK